MIYCCGCETEVEARRTTGKEIYPHRKDLHSKNFWKCDACKNYVGCHNRGHGKSPVGCIPTKELMNARRHIHSLLDPLWKKRKIQRTEVYDMMSKRLGYEYHTGEIQSITEARRVYRELLNLKKEILCN